MNAAISFAEGMATQARDTARSLPVRMLLSVGGSALLGANLGWPAGVTAFAAMMLAEGFSLAINRGQVDDTSLIQAWLRLGGFVATSIIWTAMAVAYWQFGGFAGQVVALVQLCSLLIVAQNLSFKSLAGALGFGVLPALTLIALPAMLGGFHGAQLVNVAVSVGLALFYLANDTRDNVRHAKQLREAQAALEAQTRRAEAGSEAKSAFLAMISHELRTPMNGVLGMARALDRSELDARQHEQVQMLLRSGEGLMHILNDLLDLSKIEAGRFELDEAPLDLRELAQHTVALWADTAREKGLELIVEIAPAVPQRVSGDVARLRQILNNLMSNALKFTGRGSVTLRVTNALVLDGAATIEFALTDTGIGMSPAQQAKVFEPFVQAEASTARQFGGTGLGLSICREFAALMGGEITAESEEGVGSTFRLRLRMPLAAESAGDAEAGFSLTGLRVLVADDNSVNRAVAQSILEALGAEVASAGDGKEALAALRKAAFDVVLMDVHMPWMDGLEAVRRIRAGEAGPADQPVVALTADAMPGTDAGLIAKGFDATATKPIAPQALIAAIAQACSRPEAKRDASAAA